LNQIGPEVVEDKIGDNLLKNIFSCSGFLLACTGTCTSLFRPFVQSVDDCISG